MAKCAICEKGAHFGNNVSHSHRRSPKMWKSNVKSVRVKDRRRFSENVRLYFLPEDQDALSVLNSRLMIQYDTV